MKIKYEQNKEFIVATYADGGIVSSLIRSETDADTHYHYMCAFANEECAREFLSKSLNEPVFFETKSMKTLAKEFNVGVVYPGMAGVAYVDEKNMAIHVDADSLVRMALDDIMPADKSYGDTLVVNGEITKTENIDFNKKYFIMFNSNGHMVTNRTYNQNGKRRDWLVVTTSRELIHNKAAEFGINKKNREIIEDTLIELIMRFLPKREFDGMFAGIEYIDENVSKRINNNKIKKILQERQQIIDDAFANTEMYMDARYFIAAEKQYGSPTMSTVDGIDYIVVSPRMDVLYRAFELGNMDMDEMLFTNAMTLREIVEYGTDDNYGGIAMCLDDNPDHIIYLTMNNVHAIAQNGDGDENDGYYDSSISEGSEFVMEERYVMMRGCDYVISTIQHPETGESIDVVVLADTAEILTESLDETEYVYDNDENPTSRPTYEIFAEFRDGALEDCYGIVYFDGDSFYVVPKEAVIDTLETWEKETNLKSSRVDLDFDEQHCIGMIGHKPLTFTQPDGTSFVLVAHDPEALEFAIIELFHDDDDVVYDNSKTLGQIAESAIFGNMGIAMCDDDGIIFIEPKRLSQALYDD